MCHYFSQSKYKKCLYVLISVIIILLHSLYLFKIVNTCFFYLFRAISIKSVSFFYCSFSPFIGPTLKNHLALLSLCFLLFLFQCWFLVLSPQLGPFLVIFLGKKSSRFGSLDGLLTSRSCIFFIAFPCPHVVTP